MDDLDWTSFGNSLLGDASSLAGTATLAGRGDILSDITGTNYTQQFLSRNGLTSASSGGLLQLLVIGFIIYFIVKEV